MSYVFDFRDEVIWSPSLRTGRLYVEIAKTLSNIVSAPHGFHAMAADYYELDIDTFRAFIEAVSRDLPLNHPVSESLVHGFLATSLVLLERMGHSVSRYPGSVAAEDVSELSSSMPR